MLSSVIFWFILALIFALVEIESEGKRGWAEKFPTWYRSIGFVPRLCAFLIGLGKKPLTGYHLFMFFLTAMIFHIPFFMGVNWSLAVECSILAKYLAWCVVWDYLWFIFNPYYGAKNFKKRYVWWHAKSYWLFGLFPLDYFLSWLISIGFACLTQFLSNQEGIIFEHFQFLSYFVIFTLIAIVILAPPYRWWYKKMRERDDRDQTGIF